MNSESKQSIPSWMKTAAPVLAVAVVFGVAGYFITPRSAQSALQESARSLGDVQDRLEKTVAEQKKLDKQLSDTRTELVSTVARAAAAAEAAEAEQAKVAAAEKFIAQLNAKLDREKQVNMESLTEAKKLAADSQVQAGKSRSRADALATELLAVRTEKERLDKAGSALLSDRSRLTDSLASQQQTSAELKRFLAVLDLGDNQALPARPAASQQSVEMPITTGELIRRMGGERLIITKVQHGE